MRSVAIELATETMNYKNDLNTRLIDTAKGIDLEICGNDKGKKIIEATYATGLVKITGVNGTLIKKGYRVLNSTSNIEYEITEDKIIENISTHVLVIAKTPGKIGNCEIGQINSFKEIYPGLSSVINEVPFISAIDRENDEEYRKRLLDYIRHPRISWNKYVFEDEARVIKEVDKAKCIPIGNGNVKLIITEKNKPIASEKVKTDVKNYITNKILSDINLEVLGVTLYELNLSIEANINQDFNMDNAKEEIIKNLNEYFFNNLFSTRFLYFDIANVILNCKSIDKLSDLKINNTKDDLVISEDKLCIINQIKIGGIE
ncbi:MAG: baseplate J/gp47 family protein [Cetobacterium sp.]|uniref:baseplate J/gp47 family protein n=1 Tax=Cetobacterium sp. TaxID=2071632 RepID=UPI003F383EE3